MKILKVERRGRPRTPKYRFWKSVGLLLVIIGFVMFSGHKAKVAEIANYRVEAYQEQADSASDRFERLAEENALLKLENNKLKEIADLPVDETKPDFRKVVKAKTMMAALKEFGPEHLNAFEDLIGNKESGFNPYAINPSSGACGMFQALPCSKMGGIDIENQIKWGLNYIKARYGDPSKALAFWLNNKKTTGSGWY